LIHTAHDLLSMLKRIQDSLGLGPGALCSVSDCMGCIPELLISRMMLNVFVEARLLVPVPLFALSSEKKESAVMEQFLMETFSGIIAACR
jgi:hypothetical protein